MGRKKKHRQNPNRYRKAWTSHAWPAHYWKPTEPDEVPAIARQIFGSAYYTLSQDSSTKDK